MSLLPEVHPDDGKHGASPESKKEISIYINTRECFVAKRRVTYQDLVTLAFPGEVANPDKVFDITFSSEHGPDGSVGVGGEVSLKEGMVFNVGITNRS